MSRAQNKAELLAAAQKQYEKLQQLIVAMSTSEQEATFSFEMGKEAHWRRDKNLRDVLAHLFAWQDMLLIWAAANQSGITQPFLPVPYTWKTTPALNEEFRAKYKEVSLAQMKDMLTDSHKQIIALIETFSNEELFTKAYFSWTGTTSLGSYCVSATASHYDWAIKKLRAYMKAARAKTS